MAKDEEKAFEIAQILLRLKAKRPDIYRQIIALIKAIVG